MLMALANSKRKKKKGRQPLCKVLEHFWLVGNENACFGLIMSSTSSSQMGVVDADDNEIEMTSTSIFEEK